MDDSHESLPAPEKAPTNAGGEVSSAPQGLRAVESEQTAARVTESPAFSSPQQQATQSTGNPQNNGVNNQSVAASMANQTQTSATQPVTTPQIADDVDLIEKEWVHKTKEIVNNTKDDPHRQNSQIAHLRADYMKKRYNKYIKLLKES